MRSAVFLIVVITLCGCYRMRTSKGGGQIAGVLQREYTPTDILVPPGYKVDLVASGLTFPSALTFDANGNLYIVETGYSYGEVWTDPKLVRINADRSTQLIATGGKNGPWNGVAFHEGNFYVSEGGALEGGKILKVSPDGNI